MKLKDIRENIDESIDMSDKKSEPSSMVLGDASEIFKDIETWKDTIKLSTDQTIVVEKNEGKIIDSVSKKSILTQKISLKKKWDIKLRIRHFFSKKHYLQTQIEKIEKKEVQRKIVWNIYFLLFLIITLILGVFLYKDILEKYLAYSYETLSFVKNDFPDYNAVNKNISEAKSGFLVTQYLFKPISFLNTQSVNDAWDLIEWWQYLTQWLEQLSRVWFDFLLLTKQKELSEILLSHFLDNSREDFHAAYLNLELAYQKYKNIEDLWEDDLNEKLDYLKKWLGSFLKQAKYLDQNYDTLLNILGHSERKKYMVVFQNSDEIRPQWGFMGSVWFLEVFWWKVQKFEKKDIYALEWEINKDPFREPAPEWIDRITGTFGLRDANYFIGTKSSSYKIKEILERWNIKIDGIIYLNINLAKDILDALWWVDSKVLWTQVNGDNFPLIMSSLVESKKRKEGTLDSPKDVLFDFIDELIQTLIEDRDYNLYSEILFHSIKTRDIFMYAFEEEAEGFLSEVWWNGEIDYTGTKDFNYPVFTSISWNKSDRYVERSYSKYVSHLDNCDINTRLNVKVRHNFSLADERDAIDVFEKYDIDLEENLFIQWLWNNKQFVRIVVPKEAIIKNNNLVVREYPETKVLEFYMDTPRFESSYFVLNYSLPNSECRKYDFKFFKQPGIRDYNFEFVHNDESMKFTWIREDFEYKLQ